MLAYLDPGTGSMLVQLLVGGLAGLGLVDEYRLLVHPVVLGQGKKLFGDGLPVTDLTLVESRELGSGLLLAVYRPADRP